MTVINKNGEVADFLDVSQFEASRSAYECVAYAASLIRYAGLPGKGPTGTVLQASNLAQYWYGREEGSTDASNTNGMSLDALYAMLTGMGLSYQEHACTLEAVRSALAEGMPVILCGAETGMHDMELGDRVPYSWTPTGNHAIVVSGVAHDGNLLVHDTANIGPSGVRSGPRIYDASKMQIVSVTAVHLLGEEQDEMTKTLSIAEVATDFKEVDGQHWQCIHPHAPYNGKVIQYAMLANYKSYGNSGLCGRQFLGLPCSNEIYIGKDDVVQFYQFGVQRWKDGKMLGPVDLYAQGSPGQDPYITQLEKIIGQMKAAQTSDPQAAQALSIVKQIQTLVKSF